MMAPWPHPCEIPTPGQRNTGRVFEERRRPTLWQTSEMAVRSIHDVVNDAKAEIDNISPAEAKRRVEDEGALILDIRDVRELQREGVIPGVQHAPRGMLEFWFAPDSPYFKSGFGEDREFILHCASGWRSALACKALKDMGVPRVSHIETGFTGWRDDGLPLTDYEAWKASKPTH